MEKRFSRTQLNLLFLANMRQKLFECVHRISRSYSSRFTTLVDIKPEVEHALKTNAPIVALESTIITHGMPYPQNIETALNVEAIVREKVISLEFRQDRLVFFIEFDH